MKSQRKLQVVEIDFFKLGSIDQPLNHHVYHSTSNEDPSIMTTNHMTW